MRVRLRYYDLDNRPGGRVVGVIRCSPCEKALATLYATTDGEVWRIPDGSGMVLEGDAKDVTDVAVKCRHGAVTVEGHRIDQARRRPGRKAFVVMVHH